MEGLGSRNAEGSGKGGANHEVRQSPPFRHRIGLHSPKDKR